MPLPQPGQSEDERTFISRCMGDSVMKQDYPTQPQRFAVCQSQWDRRKKSDDSAASGALRFIKP